LAMEGYVVRSALDGEAGLAIARDERPDLILVDLMLPKIGGLDVIRAFRGDDAETPILIISAKGQESDKVIGLQLGADDYIVKPFSLKELLARIDAALRRRRARGETGAMRAVRRFGRAEVDVEARRLLVDGEEVTLTTREFDLLAYFVQHPDRVFSREQLMKAVWGAHYLGTARTVDNFVARLRAHVGDDANDPRWLETVRGYGYRFTPTPK
ncbi:MAG TPA: response regulator transcription factor, partial [Anaeromyxobacteraceae bacterium]|nr:response regulator transcription factor [Anaeromyxobacteraceae bacterium]